MLCAAIYKKVVSSGQLYLFPVLTQRYPGIHQEVFYRSHVWLQLQMWKEDQLIAGIFLDKWFKLFHRFTYNGFILASFHARHGLIAQKLNFRCVCVCWSLLLYKINLLLRSVTMEATVLKQKISSFVL